MVGLACPDQVSVDNVGLLCALIPLHGLKWSVLSASPLKDSNPKRCADEAGLWPLARSAGGGWRWLPSDVHAGAGLAEPPQHLSAAASSVRQVSQPCPTI